MGSKAAKIMNTDRLNFLVLTLIISFGLSVQLKAEEASTVEAKVKLEKTPPSTSSRLLGMSVTGNKESPRSLTIVPWRDPLMDGKAPEITPVWQPSLGLLDPDSYRRDINLFIRHRNFRNSIQNANQ